MPEIRNDLEFPMRRPYGWWDQFTDGNTHVFAEGVDMPDGFAVQFCRNAHAWTGKFNDRYNGALSVQTRKFTEDGVVKVALKWTGSRSAG
jgi:hypothetical protein